MMRMPVLALLSATACMSGCAPAPISQRPCPMVTQYPPEVLAGALAELRAPPPKPNIERVMGGDSVDRAHNGAICP